MVWLQGLDRTIFLFINQTCRNPFFDWLMPHITNLGSGETLFAIALIFLIFAPRDKKKMAILIIAGLTITYHIAHYLKEWIGRPRPFVTLSNVHVMLKANGYSFPSGHTIQTFMTATVLSGFFKRAAAFFFAIAISVGFSRVYVGHHYVSDVIAGAILGMLVGWALVKISGEAQS